MKKYVRMKEIAAVCLFIASSGIAGAQIVKSKAYPTGIYIYCDNELPKRFEYVIERKGANDADYVTVASLRAPNSETDCKGRVMSLPAVIAAGTPIEDAVLAKVWQQCYRNQWLDSLYAYALDPRYQYAAGCAWFDDKLAAGTYSYRISRKDRGDQLTPVKEERVSFPSASYNGMNRVVRFKPEERDVIIHYALSDTLSTAGLKIYRSKHKENDFVEIPVNVSFMQVNRQTVAQVIDASAAKGVTYSYVAVAYDALGNMGKPGDTLNVYNMVRAGDIGMIQEFNVKADDEKNGVAISWKLKTDAGLTSIELFRSSSYDGQYSKIASLPPSATSFLDDGRTIRPATSYFYYIVANASYGRSFPSARTPAILKGSNPNILPPQNIGISRSGNIVTLTFLNADPDTRGYYVYRAKGFTGELKQLQRMLLTTDSAATYRDTLPVSGFPETYSYAVADVNTSYAISPLSDRVSIQTSGSLPVAANVNALLNNSKVFVTWKDATDANPAVSGYKIYRSALDAQGKVAEAAKMIASISREGNSFTDSTVNKGYRYRYQVQVMGLEGDEGNLSQWASISIADDLPILPGQVLAYAADKKAVIKWDAPADNSVTKIRIYRATAGVASTLLKELPASATSYEDTSLQIGKTYYYMLSTVTGNNKESELTDAVAVKLR